MQGLMRKARARISDNLAPPCATVTLETGEATSLVLFCAILDFEQRLYQQTGDFDYHNGSTCVLLRSCAAWSKALCAKKHVCVHTSAVVLLVGV